MNTGKQLHILLFCQHTLEPGNRSGIQRVVMELANELSCHCKLDFVKWDYLDGQLRFLDKVDLEALFLGQKTFSPNKHCHRVQYRFGDLLSDKDNTWLLYPELPYLLEHGNEVFSRINAQCQAYGIGTAAIFYDSIPVREADYGMYRNSHVDYMIRLAKYDMILPISRFAANDFIDYFRSDVGIPSKYVAQLAAKTIPVALGECRRDESWCVLEGGIESPHPTMIMVGTIEPRKQQVRLLRVLNDALGAEPCLRDLKVEVFGSLHPVSAEEFWQEVNRNRNITYNNYVPDSVIDNAYVGAWFSAFPSLHEGFGLPIVESLRRGTPCLTANFGAMEEVASLGGCYMTDVRDEEALLQSLVSMVSDAELRAALRHDIKKRPLRTWISYAEDILFQMAKHSASATALDDVVDKILCLECFQEKFTLDNIKCTVLSGPLTQFVDGIMDCIDDMIVIHITEYSDDISMSLRALQCICSANVLVVPTMACKTALVELANRYALEEPLPDQILVASDKDGIRKAVDGLYRSRRRHKKARREETLLREIISRRIEIPDKQELLSIVLSTYNRGPFVSENVKWILSEIDRNALPVTCVVIDNASTDDTFLRLQPFLGHLKFRYECNPANTGMLGNLHVCSTKFFGQYIWLTGDDDFIYPGAIQRTLQALHDHPGLPLYVHNFSVYYRDALRDDDHPEKFINEMIRLSPKPSNDGVYSINHIAGEHDNLYTAIYPLIFRSDTLAACFNYPFTGIPFHDLVESVPTTKYIFENLATADGYWFSEVGIVGNGQNSWSTHRPRWHLVIIPQIMALARACGVDRMKTWKWSTIHVKLFMESLEIALNRNLPLYMSMPKDLDEANFFFRSKITLPSEIALSDGTYQDFWIPTLPRT